MSMKFNMVINIKMSACVGVNNKQNKFHTLHLLIRKKVYIADISIFIHWLNFILSWIELGERLYSWVQSSGDLRVMSIDISFITAKNMLY